jgi:hypothetical protein
MTFNWRKRTQDRGGWMRANREALILVGWWRHKRRRKEEEEVIIPGGMTV